MSRRNLTAKINKYLYKAGNAKASKAQIKVARGGIWIS